MDMKITKERRKTQRLGIPLQMQYHFSSKKKTLIEEVFTKDISGGGVGLRLEQPLKVGTKLKTAIYFPNDPRPISAISKVVWSKKALRKGRPSFDVGIKHLKIVPKDKERFVYLFCEMMINYFVLSKKISYEKSGK
jgi:c-di-GMP-binding flagellar brake protein YcgR